MSRPVKLLRSQALAHLVNANVCYNFWPRAGGKTTGGIGPRINHLDNVMPRSQIILYSDTFERIHDRIAPNVAEFLSNEMQMEDGQDFVQFKKPPEHFKKPLIPLNKFDHVISFASGMALCCASQKVPGSANAYNAQALIVDEAKYIREEKINTEVLPAIRGARKWFGHLPEYRSQWYFTDKWGENIKWLLAKRKLVNHDQVRAALTLQLELNKILSAVTENPELFTPERQAHYQQLEIKLAALRRRLVFVNEAQPYENLEILGEQYFRDLRRDLKPLEYSVAIENADPDTIEHTFYPELDSRFHYHNLEDYDLAKPMIIALDYNWRITPMPVAQFSKLPGSVYTTLNIICGIDTQHPTGGIETTLEIFCTRYADHPTKKVYYLFDHTAVGKNPAGKSFRDITTAYLRNAGWIVVELYMHQAPDHDIKFENIKLMMANRTEYAIKINKMECTNLIKSLQNAGAIVGAGKTKKDKRQEKNLSIPVEEATDFSDAFDQLVWGAIELKLIGESDNYSIPLGLR